MNKPLTLALSVLALLPCLSYADPYDDRVALSIQKERQQQEANYFGWIYSNNVKAQRAMNAFIAAHGGQHTEGTCEAYVGTCKGHLCMGEQKISVPVSAVVPDAGYYITDCRLDLNDGLACQIHSFLYPEKGGYVTDCYDAAGNNRRLYLGAGSVSANAKKRKKR